jgi:hypothetical protein
MPELTPEPDSTGGESKKKKKILIGLNITRGKLIKYFFFSLQWIGAVRNL